MALYRDAQLLTRVDDDSVDGVIWRQSFRCLRRDTRPAKLDFAGQTRQFPPLLGPTRPSSCGDHLVSPFPYDAPTRPCHPTPARESHLLMSLRSYLDFEKPVAELEAKVEELRAMAAEGDAVAIGEELTKLESKAAKALADLYAALTPWQKTMVARHQQRPHFGDYVKRLIEDFTPLAGDRKFAEDEAIVGGFGRFRGQPVCILGHEKGFDTDSRIRHNFGMARPEGYRKAARLMELADRFDLPVISLVDTAGAFPGIDAEERGQAEAIARSTDACLALGVPNVAVIVGEGGSGGAVAIATANRVAMLEHAIYTVASPEASASILWRDSSRRQEAAQNMKITAQDLLKFGIIDVIVSEPLGGAHRDPAAAIDATGSVIAGAFESMHNMSRDEIRAARAEKFLAIGRRI